jgi:hypothetical protein
LQKIIYDPQQKNMDSVFSAPDAQIDQGNVWHVIQSYFREIGYELYTPASYQGNLEDVSWVIFSNMPNELKPVSLRKRVKRYIRDVYSERTFFKKCVKARMTSKMAVILYEPEVVFDFNYDIKNNRLFEIVFTWNRSLIEEGGKYREFVYPQEIPSSPMRIVPFEDRKLICNFSANKKSTHTQELYSARINTIRFFEENCLDEFDHFGRGWSSDYKSWRGTVVDKKTTMSGYKFNLCYENALGFRGYVTEKIFDALHAGCVPVYLGAPDIEDSVPPEAFIDRRQFNSDEELLKFLRSVGRTRWEALVDAGQEFLKSAAYEKYTAKGIFTLLRNGLFGTS